jgi:hypothetical protein
MIKLIISRSSLAFVLALGLVAGLFLIADQNDLTTVRADMAPQTLPFAQTWENTGIITTDDDWSGVLGITGFRGDDLTATTGTDPRTILADGSGTPIDVLANQSSPGTVTAGAVAEFDGIANPTIAMQGSGTADAPHIVIYLNTTGETGIQLSYNARDIDDQMADAIQQVDTQYRVGGTGDYTSIAGGYIADATSGESTATLVTPVSVTLPDAANNQSLVEVRIITTNALGSDEFVGIDDIAVTAGGGPNPPDDADADFDGDGATDFAVVRDTGGALRAGTNFGRSFNDLAASAKTAGERGRAKTSKGPVDNLGATPGDSLTWFINNSSDNSATIASFGDADTDSWTPSDFDGDGMDDIAVWRGIDDTLPSGNAFFFILNSSDSTVDVVDFGQDGDNPTVVGDYDGDGMADVAVYRQPLGAPFGQSFFFYRGSAGMGEITFVPWGDNTNEDLKAYPGDFDGDGRHDFCVYRRDPANLGANRGQYVLLRSSDGGVEYITWGIKTLTGGDILTPGDYDGDGMTDFMNTRVEGTAVRWYLLERDGGGTGANAINWGSIAVAGTSEFAAQGDYDGDGMTDIAIYRRNNTDPNNCNFWVRRSSDMAVQVFEWGATADVPVNAWNAQ